MNIQNLNLLPSINVPSLDLSVGNTKNAANAVSENSFDSLFQAFMNLYTDTDTSIREANNIQLDIAQGKTDDVLALTMAMEKANASLNFTVQVTNRVLEAYRQIMQMQM